jgi:hypothetical protein
VILPSYQHEKRGCDGLLPKDVLDNLQPPVLSWIKRQDKNKEEKRIALLRNNLILYLAISTLITRFSLNSFAKSNVAGVTPHLIAAAAGFTVLPSALYSFSIASSVGAVQLCWC